LVNSFGLGALFEHLRWRGAPGVFAFHVPNGGKRTPAEAAIFKGVGARAGVPDVIAIHQGRCYAVELKTDVGRLTNVQAAALAALERAGALTAVCRGLDAALHRFEAWGLLLRSSRFERSFEPSHQRATKPRQCTADTQGRRPWDLREP
jgi:hypothetical protein